MDKLKQFYTGKSWRDLSYSLKISRGGKCERCGFMVVEKSDWVKLIGHHKIELTEANISDPNISLNPNNVEIVCIDCHNKSHRRFGHRKQVYIVWGSHAERSKQRWRTDLLSSAPMPGVTNS